VEKILLLSTSVFVCQSFHQSPRWHQCPCGTRRSVPASTSLHPRFSVRASTLIGQFPGLWVKKLIEHLRNNLAINLYNF
jgi:hypothetical protein